MDFGSLILFKLSLSLFLFLATTLAFGSDKQPPVKWSGNIYKVIHNHTEKFEKFSKKVCGPRDAAKYWTLLKSYRGTGFYLPKLGEDIDREAIKKNLHHFQKKISYIDSLITKLKTVKVYPNFKLIHNELDQTVKELLSLKKKHQSEIRREKREQIRKESARNLIRLQKQFDIFLNHIFFLKSYQFPNDFLDYRERYEGVKDKEGIKYEKMANEIFFFRKIVEDGAFDPDHTRPDRYVRATLDTLYLNIKNEKDFISENVRFDLEWIEKNIENNLARGKKQQLARLKEWHDRTQDSLNFYREIIKSSNIKKARFLVKKEHESAENLRDFVYQKQGEVYNYWAKEDELSKALFVLETILVHEVGVIDGEYGLERSAVAEVVINRYYDDFYNQLNPKQKILEYISPQVDTKKELWLNVLFKVGEFSFTYHYIPAVSHTFCPDMSKRGKSIRAKNLKIALKSLKNYNEDFEAFRYFSRISMPGKIDMSSVWTEYDRMPEMVGYEAKDQQKLTRYFLADKYEYFYTFVDAKQIEYTVLRILDTTYSMRYEKGKPVFYDYRSPHLFTYFSKKK